MRKPIASLSLIVAGVALAAGLARAADDDLAVVKRAVGASPAPRAQEKPAPTPTAAPAAAKAEAPNPRPAGKAQWLRVRVTERGGKKVSINLPLALVRAMDDWPIDWHCRDREAGSCRLRIGDVLNALDAGQSLVEIDDDDGAKVRVWIE